MQYLPPYIVKCIIFALLSQAKELGYDSLAITDHGVMYGVIEFYETCLREGIKPILGCEVYVSPGSRFDREVGKGDDRYITASFWRRMIWDITICPRS